MADNSNYYDVNGMSFGARCVGFTQHRLFRTPAPAISSFKIEDFSIERVWPLSWAALLSNCFLFREMMIACDG